MDITVLRDGIRLAAKYEKVADPIVIMSHGFIGDLGFLATSV